MRVNAISSFTTEILCNDSVTIIQLTEKEESMLGNTLILLIVKFFLSHNYYGDTRLNS